MFCILQDIFNVKYDILYLKKYHHTDIQFSMSALAENISLPAISIKNSLKDSRINS